MVRDWHAGCSLHPTMCKTDQKSNVPVVVLSAFVFSMLTSGCGGEVCGFARPNNQFTIDFTQAVRNYRGTVETGDVWLRSARKYNLRGDETNAILLRAEHSEARTIDVECVDGALVAGNAFFGPDCSEFLFLSDGDFIPLHFRVELESSDGSARFPEDGKAAFETYEEIEGTGSCAVARELGSVTLDTNRL